MKKRKFMVPRQATDAAGSKAKPQVAGQAEAETPSPSEKTLKRPKQPLALQLARSGPTPAGNPPKSLVNIASKNEKNDSTKNKPPPQIPAKVLLRKTLHAASPPPPSGLAAPAPAVAAPAPTGGPRRPFRIPALPSDALPPLSDLFKLDTSSIFSSLAHTIQKEASLPDAAATLFPKLASFDSEASSLAAAEILDRILPSYYEHDTEKKIQGEDVYTYPQGLHGVIFGLSGKKTKDLHTYCHLPSSDFISALVLVPLPETAAPAPAPAAAAAAAPWKTDAFSKHSENIVKTTPCPTKNQTSQPEVQFSTFSDSGASILSSAVWIPTPGGDGKEENLAYSEAALRRCLAEDAEIPLSFLKSLLF